MRFYVSVWGQNALFRKVRFSSPGQTWRDVTEKRTLRVPPHGKAQSACALSRKSALCMRAVTQTASLRHGGTAWGSECAFLSRHGHRMRLCVSVWGQNALFRKLRFSSPGQTWRHLTEKRILRVPSHGKAHSARRISRKGALCMRAVTQSAPFRHGGTAWMPRLRFSVTSRPQSASLRECPGPECAFP